MGNFLIFFPGMLILKLWESNLLSRLDFCLCLFYLPGTNIILGVHFRQTSYTGAH